MRPRTTWIFILLLVIAGEVHADNVQRFVDSLQLPQTAFCGFDPEIHVLERWPDRSTKTFVATYTTDNECWTALGIFRAHRNGRFQRLAEWDGMPRRIELLDVTGNGVPEILATSRPGNRSAPVFILKWDGAKLTEIDEKQEPYPGRLLPVRATGADEYTQGEVELPSRCVMLDVILDGPPEATVAILIEMI